MDIVLTALGAATSGLGAAVLSYRVTRRARQARTFIRQAHEDRLEARRHREVTEKLYNEYGPQVKAVLDGIKASESGAV